VTEQPTTRRDVTLVPRVSVADAVHDQLRHAILSGAQAVGTRLPAERALAASAGVNRQAVREAVQRLRQAGLVEVHQGEGVRVLDWRRTGTIGLLLDTAVRPDGSLEPDLILSLLQLRVVVLVDAAREAARHATADAVAELEALLAAMLAEPDDTPVSPRFGYWEALVRASGNVAYRLAFNTQFAIARRVTPETLAFLAAGARLRDRYVALTAAVAAHDAAAAADEARAIVSPIVEALEGGS
jgi:DNA-binding FadR family transcriptional regulator